MDSGTQSSTHWFAGIRQRLLAWRCRQTAEYFLYRNRYLIGFILIGFAAICLELLLVHFAMPDSWPMLFRATVAMLFGVMFGFVLNAKLNFKVRSDYFFRTFAKYAAVSVLSFTLNMIFVNYFSSVHGAGYPVLRLGTAAVLFSFAYALHRYFTFDQARNLGIAVYATDTEDVAAIYTAVGSSCDHVHMDLVDDSMARHTASVDLSRITEARWYWPDRPIALHLMTKTPACWLDQTWDCVDWYLFHLEVDEDLHELIFACHQRRKKVGIVWRVGNRPAELIPFLPHVDFVMVLGIAKPGQSGQTVCQESLELLSTLSQIRGRYKYELMFDGGIKLSNINSVDAKYIVTASAVLRADNPIKAVHDLRRPARYRPSRAA